MRADVATRPGGRTSEASHKGLREHRSIAVAAAVDGHGFRDRYALDRLEHAQEHAGADAGTFTRHVDAKMHAIDEVDVGVAAAQEQRAVALYLAHVGVAAGVPGT